MDFIKLFNGVVARAKPVSAADSNATSLDDKLADLNLDSLDNLMVSIYFGGLYGIEEEVMQTMQCQTVGELQEFLEANKTQKVTSVEAALQEL